MNSHDTKTRLAGEIVRIVFGESIAPHTAWTKIDAIVDETFGEWSDKRRQNVIDDVCKMRACIDDCAPEDVDGPSGVSTDLDWATFSCVIADCQRIFDRPRGYELSEASEAPGDWLDRRESAAFNHDDDDNDDVWDGLDVTDAP